MNMKDLGRFLKWLSTDTNLVFQTFGEGAKKGTKSLVSVLPLRDKASIAKLAQLNKHGAGCFIQINEGKARGAKHITGVRAVFLDLDNAPLKPVLVAVKKGEIPKPAVIVESSPGRYHVYWRCVDASIANFALIQKTLAARFDGDMTVHNLDRVMRLPGTLNNKSEPWLVKILHYDPELTCSADELLEWREEEEPHFADNAADYANAAGRMRVALDSVTDSLGATGFEGKPSALEDETPLRPGDRTQRIIAMAGALVADNPRESLKTLARMLVAKVQDRTPDNVPMPSAVSFRDEIFPGLKRFWEKQQEENKGILKADAELAQEYRSGEFEAYQQTVSDDKLSLKDFADRYVLVESTGMIYDLHRVASQEPMTLSNFKVATKIHKEEGAELSNKWLKNGALRRTVQDVTYKPYALTLDTNKLKMQRFVLDPETHERCYNRYMPPALVPSVELDKKEQLKLIEPFINHLKWLMHTPEKFELMLSWMAATVQRPDQRILWAPLLISIHQGVGKGLLAQLMQRLVGRSNYGFVSASDLDKSAQYNEYLSETTLTIIDEVHQPRKQEFVNQLNSQITEPYLTINRKYGSKGMERVYTNFMCFSNHEDALALTKGDRRFFVHIFYEKPKSYSYYNKLVEWMEGEGPSALLGYLLEYDISRFEFGACPRLHNDEDKRTLSDANISDLEYALDTLLSDMEGPFKGKVTCRKLVCKWLENQERLIIDKDIDRDIDRWFRSRKYRALGKLALGNEYKAYRTVRWTSFDPDIDGKNSHTAMKEARRSVKSVEGGGTVIDNEQDEYRH